MVYKLRRLLKQRSAMPNLDPKSPSFNCFGSGNKLIELMHSGQAYVGRDAGLATDSYDLEEDFGEALSTSQ